MKNKAFMNGKSVILVSSCNYNMHTKNMLNAQILAEEMAERGTNVLFVESLGLKTVPLAGSSDLIKVFLRLIDFVKMLFLGVNSPKSNLWVLSPVRLPFEKFGFIGRLNRIIVKSLIGHYSKHLGFKTSILWIMLPTAHYLVGEFDESLVIYHCVDDYSQVPFVDSTFIKKNEKQMAQKADLVLAVSNKMTDELSKLNQNTKYINNVARFNLFNKALGSEVKVPDDLLPILRQKKSIVGFVGNIASYKEDLELLSEIARNMPDLNFIFIGPVGSGEVNTNIENLKKLKNVYLLGSKDYWQIYKYFKFFDVALIARRLNEANEGGFPLKYFEYMAAGLPVVVTNVATLHEFSLDPDLGGIATNSNEFEKRINYWINMKKNNPKLWEALTQKRLNIAKQNSWEERMEMLDKLVTDNLKK